MEQNLNARDGVRLYTYTPKGPLFELADAYMEDRKGDFPVGDAPKLGWTINETKEWERSRRTHPHED